MNPGFCAEVGNHVYDQEVESSEYLATPATCMTPARYYKSCICGAKGTEAVSYTHLDVYKRQVVRCFVDDNIIHVDGSVDPLRDIETINLELIFSDIEMLERRIDKTAKMMKGDKKYAAEYDLLNNLKTHLEEGKPARTFECTEEESDIIKTIALLTLKPVIYAANMSEDDFIKGLDNNKFYQDVKNTASHVTFRQCSFSSFFNSWLMFSTGESFHIQMELTKIIPQATNRSNAVSYTHLINFSVQCKRSNLIWHLFPFLYHKNNNLFLS